MNNAFLNGNYKKLFLWFNIPFQMQVYSSTIIHKVNGKSIFMFEYIDDRLVTNDDDVKLIKQYQKKFALKILGSLNYFLGFQAFQNEE